MSVKTLQRLVGKCVSFSLAIPGAILFTREMNHAIAKGLRTSRAVNITSDLQEEISQWLFLRTWDDPFPWREERHLRICLASDASASGWGGAGFSLQVPNISDYWTEEEQGHDIATKEALALDRVLLSFPTSVRNRWVDAYVDNQAVIQAWRRQGGRSISLNRAIKKIFITTLQLNIALSLTYIPTHVNPADRPSRRLSTLDSRLHPEIWDKVQREFAGLGGHTCDLMALDSNAMTDLNGDPLPHFTPHPTPESSGVNVFAQDLSVGGPLLAYPYVFPPFLLVGPVLCLLETDRCPCTMVTLDIYPKRYWWPIIQKYAIKSHLLAIRGDTTALLSPSKTGWQPSRGIPGDLWVFSLRFPQVE